MKKAISFILSFLMVLTMLPSFGISAFAAEKLPTPELTINGAVLYFSEVENATNYMYMIYDADDTMVANSAASYAYYQNGCSFVDEDLKKGQKYTVKYYCSSSDSAYEQSDTGSLEFTYNPYVFGYANNNKTVIYTYNETTSTLTFSLNSEIEATTDSQKNIRGFDYQKSQFFNTNDIKHVVVSDGILGIESYPFYRAKVEDITIPSTVSTITADVTREFTVKNEWIVSEDNTRFSAINGSLYSKSGTALYAYSQGTDTSFTTPSNLVCIYDEAFSGEISLDTLTLTGNNLEVYSYGINGITVNNIVFGEGLKEVQSYCNVFGWKPESITIPATVTYFSTSSFLDMESVKNIYVADGNTTYSSKDGVLYKGTQLVKYPTGKTNESVVVSDDTTEIGYCAFEGSNIKQIDFPSSVTKFSEYSMNSLSGLTDVTIRALDANLKSNTFNHCPASVVYHVYEGSKTKDTLLLLGVESSKISYIACSDHNYVKVQTVTSTCFRQGYDLEECTICGKTQKTNLKAMTSHEVVNTYSNDKTTEYHKCKNYERTIIETEGLPETDHDYANLVDTDYVLSYPNASTIDITFDENFRMESLQYDYLILTDENGKVLGKYSETSLASQTLTINGDYVKLHFHSDGSTTFYGFKVTKVVAEIEGCTYEEASTAHTHSYGEYVYNNDATCSSDGTDVATCVCGSTTSKTATGTQLKHNYELVTIPATCNAAGTNTYTCSLCSDSYSEPIKKLEHEMISYYDTEIKKDVTECKHCASYDITYTEDLPQSAHPYASSIDEEYTIPSYSGANSITIKFSEDSKTESGCDYIKIYNSLDELVATCHGDNFANKEVTISGNSARIVFTSDSSREYYGFKIDSVVAHYPGCGQRTETTHVHNYQSVVTPPVCDKDGYTTYTCEGCKDSYVDDYVSASGAHDYKAFTQDGTWTSNGKIIYKCSKCEDTYDGETVYLTGKCGEDVTYTFNADTKTLTLSGTGSTSDYASSSAAPFRETNIKHVVVGEGITSIGKYLFYSCPMEDISLPSTIESIGASAFYYCTNLENLVIPDNVAKISEQAFGNCLALKTLRMPKSLETLGTYYTFYNLNALETVSIDSNAKNFKVVDNILYSADNKKLYLCPVKNTATSITVPEGVEDITHTAFRLNQYMTSITLPSTLKTLDYACFQNTKLTSITIPDSCTSIGMDQFSSSKLKSIHFGKSFKTLGMYSFNNTSIEGITVDEDNQYFKVVDNILYSKDGKTLYQYPLGSTNKEFIVPDGVETLFNNCSRGAINLEKVVLPNTLKSIGYYSFEKCPKLKTLVLPEGLSSLPSRNSFDQNAALETVYVPSTITSLEGNDFSGDSKVKTIYYGGDAKDLTLHSAFSTATVIGNHTHTYTNDGAITTPATCTETGVQAVYCDCGINSTKSVDALGHNYEVVSPSYEPICFIDGMTDGKKCSRCGDEILQQTIPATGEHTLTTSVTKATLSADGKIVTSCSTYKCPNSTTTVIKKIASVKLASTKYTYNAKVKTPSVVVKDSAGKTLVKNTDYTVSYAKGRKNVGKYAVKITFKGKYSGTKTLYFTIVPKITSITKLTALKAGFKATLKKQATQTTGYQIQYSTSSKFAKAKTVTITSNKTTSKAISKLNAKKKYYVRVRTYKTVSGKKYYSSWSAKKYVTTK